MQALAGALQVTSAHRGQSDPLGKFTEHRRYNRPIATALMADPETRDIGREIANCSSRLSLDVPLVDGQLGQPLLRGAHLCHRRLCPFCEWRRTLALRARVIRGIDAFAAEKPNWSGVFLTLTVRNCQLSELRETIAHMNASLNRLRRVSAWPTTYWLRRTEVTVKRSTSDSFCPTSVGTAQPLPPAGGGRILSVHPHIHLLLLVRPSYWGRDYIKQLRWQQEWQMAARLDYAPVVDVRRAKTRATDDHLHGVAPVSAVLEAAKYATKATDLLALGNQLPEFHHQVHRSRFFGVSTDLQRYIKASDPKGDELLDTDRFPVPAIEPSLSAVAEWMDSVQEYRFTT